MRKLTHFAIGTLLLLLTLSTGTDLILGAASTPLHRQNPPLAGRFAEMPINFALQEQNLKLQAGEQMDTLLSWTRVAFSAYRENNWEILVAQDDGSNEQRLTNHSANDTVPEMDRGCHHLVFTSDRDGDDEIYRMTTNGTDLQQLTSNTADDYNPTWSPDGSQIAFQSYRNGQSEIYVMKADGSQQVRLTTNEAYDGMPNWSPDGQRITFVSTRNNGWHIWVMDANGGNLTQLSQQKFSENPIWSPDGSQIAYDADGDNDGWQELWLMDANGANQHVIYDPGDSYDAWASSWSPDGRHVAFTQAEWFYHNGDWYWISAKLYRWQSLNGSIVPMYMGDNESHPNWQTTDTLPPTSAVVTLPPYSRQNAEVSWSGADQGIAGIYHFDIQYRLNDNVNWIDWQTNVLPNDEPVIYPHQPGNTISFRSRAVDNAFNREMWPEGEGDANTTFTVGPLMGQLTTIEAHSSKG